ncbi:uncharacterized protein LOC136081987 [Hydra vulgaris]|uniref:Uncharacterized protein LOC136081987 n=1 Tax=Hydra vulgaris TaxID=6087 RepID=A0ABM4C4S5_HYDVU
MPKSSAEKNHKRRQKNKKSVTPVSTCIVKEKKKDPLEQIKEDLQKAKEAGDHKLATKLRQDLWVLQDQIAGVSPFLNEDELEESLRRNKEREMSLQEKTVEKSVSKADKELKKLQKKLDKILNIKKMKEEGKTLEKNQLEMIEKEDEVRKELAEYESLCNEVKVIL